MMENIYMPYLMRIEKVTYEAPGVKTFMLKFVKEEDQTNFNF
jgi:sulfhydrogenase subunit gamma (sulfur reductase)